MNIKNTATTAVKVTGLTALVLGYGTFCLGKKVVKETKSCMVFAKQVYGQCKQVVENERASV